MPWPPVKRHLDCVMNILALSMFLHFAGTPTQRAIATNIEAIVGVKGETVVLAQHTDKGYKCLTYNVQTSQIEIIPSKPDEVPFGIGRSGLTVFMKSERSPTKEDNFRNLPSNYYVADKTMIAESITSLYIDFGGDVQSTHSFSAADLLGVSADGKHIGMLRERSKRLEYARISATETSSNSLHPILQRFALCPAYGSIGVDGSGQFLAVVDPKSTQLRKPVGAPIVGRNIEGATEEWLLVRFEDGKPKVVVASILMLGHTRVFPLRRQIALTQSGKNCILIVEGQCFSIKLRE